jgi:hypothetical protein
MGDFAVLVQVEVQVLSFAEVCPAERQLQGVAVLDGHFFPKGDTGGTLSVFLYGEGAVPVAENVGVIFH